MDQDNSLAPDVSSEARRSPWLAEMQEVQWFWKGLDVQGGPVITDPNVNVLLDRNQSVIGMVQPDPNGRWSWDASGSDTWGGTVNTKSEAIAMVEKSVAQDYPGVTKFINSPGPADQNLAVDTANMVAEDQSKSPELHQHVIRTGATVTAAEMAAHSEALSSIGVEMSPVEQLLLDRYGMFQEQLSAARPNTQEEAIAATNYFRGRAEELNQMREFLVGQSQELSAEIPTIAVDHIAIGPQRGHENAEEMMISL